MARQDLYNAFSAPGTPIDWFSADDDKNHINVEWWSHSINHFFFFWFSRSFKLNARSHHNYKCISSSHCRRDDNTTLYADHILWLIVGWRSETYLLVFGFLVHINADIAYTCDNYPQEMGMSFWMITWRDISYLEEIDVVKKWNITSEIIV